MSSVVVLTQNDKRNFTSLCGLLKTIVTCFLSSVLLTVRKNDYVVCTVITQSYVKAPLLDLHNSGNNLLPESASGISYRELEGGVKSYVRGIITIVEIYRWSAVIDPRQNRCYLPCWRTEFFCVVATLQAKY